MKRFAVFALVATALTLPAQQPQPRTVDKPFVILTAASFGAAALDFASTRRCIDAGTCREANPLAGQSAGREALVSFGDVAVWSFVSYELKKHHKRQWWIAPVVEIGEHGILAGASLRFSGTRALRHPTASAPGLDR